MFELISSFAEVLISCSLLYVAICKIYYRVTGIEDEEGSARLEIREILPMLCSFSVLIGVFPLLISCILEFLLILLVQYLNSDELLKKEEMQGKVYLNIDKNNELKEKLQSMSDEERELWYQDYLKRVQENLPTSFIIKLQLLCWVIVVLVNALLSVL
jgi:hypothetical protein